jgi:hypothetical protein
MRLSADPSSPFFSPDAHRVGVYLDGRYLEHCVEASEEEGWADIISHDQEGRPMVGKNGHFYLSRVLGAIEIRSLHQSE